MDEVFNVENFKAILYIETAYEDKTLKQDRVFHDQIQQILVYSKSHKASVIQEYEEYDYEKFCWYIKEKTPPKESLTLGGKKVDIFGKGDYEIIQGDYSVDGLKEIWASGTILDINSSGRFFRDYLMGRQNTDGLGSLYKVYDIGDDNNEFRYFTGPKRKGATKGKYYQGIPSQKLETTSENIKKKSIKNLWLMAAEFGNCRQEGGVELKSGKKPEKLLKTIIEMSTKPGDIVLDYHVGSGTTCAVAHKMGRQYIGIEQLDYGKNDCVHRLINVINGDKTGISKDVNWESGGEFVYCELMKYNQAFMERIQNAKNSKDLFTIWKEIADDSFLNWYINPEMPEEAVNDFEAIGHEENGLEKQKKLLMELLEKNQLYVNLSEMDDEKFNASEEDKTLNKAFYGEI